MKTYSLELLPQYTKLKDEKSVFFNIQTINVNLHFKFCTCWISKNFLSEALHIPKYKGFRDEY